MGSPGRSQKKISWKGRIGHISSFVPTGAAPERKLPLLLTLHGSGQSGETYVAAWKDVAEKEKIVVVGPNSDDSRPLVFAPGRPLSLHDVVDQLAGKQAIDSRRVYLFGHSAGAVFALQMAALESDYFAAAVAYAGSLQAKCFQPLRLRDPEDSLSVHHRHERRVLPARRCQATRDALKSRSFPVEYVEMSGQTHNYVHSAGDQRESLGVFS